MGKEKGKDREGSGKGTFGCFRLVTNRSWKIGS